MKRNIIVLGCQWGDEGKGKVVDLLAKEADVIVRFQGGANAGHTIETGGKKFILHLIPSGIIHPGKICYIGNGVVLDAFGLMEELDMLHTEGIDTDGRLFISSLTHLVMPFHKMIDEYEEKKRGGCVLGTTLRGIGPAYRDKVARCGFRLCDLFSPERLKEKLADYRETKAEYFIDSSDERGDIGKVYNDLMNIAPKLKEYMINVPIALMKHHNDGKSILFEGAQGALLDVDHGTYPYATSSNTTIGGALTGSGMSPKFFEDIVGVVKAYTTRVGEGPFPTELKNETGAKLRDIGSEYGASTGRPRRTGWLDLVILRHACRINGVEKIAVTKLDVLDSFEKINGCIGYELNGRELSEIPLDPAELGNVKPLYKEFDGWQSETTGIKNFARLPVNAKKYLKFISDDLGVEILLVSTGAGRTATIMV